MKRDTGLWIDHKQAVIVTVSSQNKHEDVKRIQSNIGKHVRYSGASNTTEGVGSHNDAAENKRDRRFDKKLKKYYDEVIEYIRDVNSLLILGPDEAKIELQARMESQQLGGLILAVKPADKMTDEEIVTEVRQVFQELPTDINPLS